jgi:hypothetical protein
MEKSGEEKDLTLHTREDKLGEEMRRVRWEFFQECVEP